MWRKFEKGNLVERNEFDGSKEIKNESLDEKSGPNLQVLLQNFMDRNAKSRDILDEAMNFEDIIHTISEYKALLNEYQKIYRDLQTFKGGTLKGINTVCREFNELIKNNPDRIIAQPAQDVDQLFSDAKRALELLPGIMLDIYTQSLAKDVSDHKENKRDAKSLFEELKTSLNALEGGDNIKGDDISRLNALFKSFVEVSAQKKSDLPEDIHVGPLKDVKRSIEKIAREYNGNHRKLMDIVRGSIIFDDLDHLYRALQVMRNQDGALFKIVVRVKDGFIDSLTSGGYRDIKLNLSINNHICEVQLHLKGFYTLKEGGGHDLYNKIREFRIQGALEATDLLRNPSAFFYECLDTVLRLQKESAQMKEKRKELSVSKFVSSRTKTLVAESYLAKYGNVQDSTESLRKVARERFELIQEASSGKSIDLLTDPTLLQFLVDWANSCLHAGQTKIASALFHLIIEKQKVTFGEDHPSFLQTVRDYSKLLQLVGLPQKSEQILRKASKIYEKLLGSSSLETIRCKARIIDPLLEQGRIHEALEIAIEVLNGRKSVYGPESKNVDITMALFDLGRIYIALDRIQAQNIDSQDEKQPDQDRNFKKLALKYLRECHEMQSETLLPSNVNLIQTQVLLAKVEHGILSQEFDFALKLSASSSKTLFGELTAQRYLSCFEHNARFDLAWNDMNFIESQMREMELTNTPNAKLIEIVAAVARIVAVKPADAQPFDAVPSMVNERVLNFFQGKPLKDKVRFWALLARCVLLNMEPFSPAIYYYFYFVEEIFGLLLFGSEVISNFLKSKNDQVESFELDSIKESVLYDAGMVENQQVEEPIILLAKEHLTQLLSYEHRLGQVTSQQVFFRWSEQDPSSPRHLPTLRLAFEQILKQ
jgi:tetratricopeptide (TPR) repeat protein